MASQSPSRSTIFLSELRVVLPLMVLPLKTPTNVLNVYVPFRSLYKVIYYSFGP